MRAAFLGMLLLVRALPACTCLATYPTCQAVAKSNIVFAGTVESIQPRFASRWIPISRSAAALLNEVPDDSSPAAVEKLKQAYLGIVSDLPQPARQAIAAARTQDEVMMATLRALDRGVQVRFNVQAVYQFHKGDDDDDADADAAKKKSAKDDNDDKAAALKSVVVWTDSGDCGFEFLPGETYLVYASGNESGSRFETSICSRTRRLTDAGEDLSYLFFRKNLPTAASRLEGFVTTSRSEVDRDLYHYSSRIGSPVPGSVLELKGSGGTRYTEADASGRWVLDGLAEGDYILTAFARGYPAAVRAIAGPRNLHIGKNDCASTVLLAPPE